MPHETLTPYPAPWCDQRTETRGLWPGAVDQPEHYDLLLQQRRLLELEAACTLRGIVCGVCLSVPLGAVLGALLWGLLRWR